LRKRDRHIDNIENNQQDQEDEHVDADDVRREIDARHVVLDVEEIENIEDRLQKRCRLPDIFELLVEGKRMHLQIVNSRSCKEHENIFFFIFEKHRKYLKGNIFCFLDQRLDARVLLHFGTALFHCSGTILHG